MEESDRPRLDPATEVAIEAAQNQALEILWSQLKSLQVLTKSGLEDHRLKSPVFDVFPAPRPKRPSVVKMHVRNCALTLFSAEAPCYPENPVLEEQLAALVRRTVTRILGTVRDLEDMSRDRKLSLEHHGLTLRDIGEAAAHELDPLVRTHLSSQSENITNDKQAIKPVRFRDSIESRSAARKMEAYISKRGMGMTVFANQAGTTDRTLRKFRKTGRLKKSIFADVAETMGETVDSLLRD